MFDHETPLQDLSNKEKGSGVPNNRKETVLKAATLERLPYRVCEKEGLCGWKVMETTIHSPSGMARVLLELLLRWNSDVVRGKRGGGSGLSCTRNDWTRIIVTRR